MGIIGGEEGGGHSYCSIIASHLGQAFRKDLLKLLCSTQVANALPGREININ